MTRHSRTFKFIRHWPWTAIAMTALVLPATLARAEPVAAVPVQTFLDSLGVNSTMPDRGQPVDKTIVMLRYCGFRWVRSGIEGVTDHGPTTVQTLLDLHRATGVRFSNGLGSGGTDLRKLLWLGHKLDDAGALLAFEGNNEPNNWGVVYRGKKGGGDAPTWKAVAELQQELYRAVKADPSLARYPVWTVSEPGAQRDNVGLQFLKIPKDAGTLMPAGTAYADAANVHNYVYHPRSPVPTDNKTWNAADPTVDCGVDGLFGNFGLTWAKKFLGYSRATLAALPRVTTETGVKVGGEVDERLQGLNLLNLYLAQFKRGYSHTAVYLLRDRTDEGTDQAFGFFRPDYSPRPAATFLHQFTAILAEEITSNDAKPDAGVPADPGALDYRLTPLPATVHDLLLRRRDGTFRLIVWGERLTGEDRVTLTLASPATVRVYDPTLGTDAVRTGAGVTSLDLVLSDHPLVLGVDTERR